ncbi:MAG: hypothetical protein SFW36_20375 [Leptolyngbyaceae cyanobacterium bins.59]|nr:hypothetical protein [Leptolyngbyaceae cyanobacterium bins.59]
MPFPTALHSLEGEDIIVRTIMNDDRDQTLEIAESTGGSALELEAEQIPEPEGLDLDESTGGSVQGEVTETPIPLEEDDYDVPVMVLSSRPDRTPTVSAQSSQSPQTSLFDSLVTLGTGLGEAATQTLMENSKVALQNATELAETVNKTVCKTTDQASRIAIVTTDEISSLLTGAVHETTRTAFGTLSMMGEQVNTTAFQTGRMLGETAVWMTENATKQLQKWLEQLTHSTGQAIDVLGNNPLIRRVSGVLRMDWLIGITDRVDLAKAEEAVHALQRQYPQESPNQIAHRLMVQKAAYASGMGFFSSILPGAAAALLAIDLAATTALQTEMVYQIAAAYGLSLKDPARKGEVLAIFGLALGGRQALRAGLGFLRNVPLAGAMIGASTNAAMLYSLGYAACRFYEAKLESTADPSTSRLNEIQEASERYLQVAIAQQSIMDQVLVHMILASYPNKTWDDILPELRRAQVSESSLEVIAANLQSPQPIGPLLEQVNRDFAVPLIAQCYRIAKASGNTISSEEARVLEAISHRTGVSLDEIRGMVEKG